jgi:hypothetical protein
MPSIDNILCQTLEAEKHASGNDPQKRRSSQAFGFDALALSVNFH